MGDIVNLFVSKKNSKLGAVSFDATISEEHTNPVIVTTNPLESGAGIQDHLFLRPRTLKIVGVVTDTPMQSLGNNSVLVNAQEFGSSTSTNITRSEAAYQTLIAIRNELDTLEVQTKLINYKNMVITDIHTITDKMTANAPTITIYLQEVLVVESKIVPLDESVLADQVKAYSQTQEGTFTSGVTVPEEESKSFAATVTDWVF